MHTLRLLPDKNVFMNDGVSAIKWSPDFCLSHLQ